MMKTQMMISNTYKMLLLTLFCLLMLPTAHGQFAKGADVSWLSEMEASGYQWYNDNGNQQDLFQILKDHGMNSIRLRTWLNPSGGWSNKNDMLALANRANNAGMDIMLTIHYSDSWADPGQQNKPSAWSGYSTQGLYDAVYSYTHDLISSMVNNGSAPKWVQIGNETNNGMLWENGKASTSMQTYAWLINSGHNAVKDVNSNIQTIVHLANGNDNALYQWNIGGIISNGANFDIIGMSLYPEPSNWQSLANDCYNNMVDMRSRYGKEVMICEIGMRQDEPQATKDFIADMLNKTRNANGLGVFYWEPQVYNGWKSYGKGAWSENGRPSIAMDAFIEGSGGGSPGSSFVQFQNRGTGLFLDGMGRTTNGETVGQWPNTTHVNSQWELVDVGNGYYQLKNRGTGFFIDGMGNTTNGADIGQWSNTSHYNSHWQLIQYSGNYYQLRNRTTGLYLDGMGRTSNGANCGQWGNTTHVNSQWLLSTISGSRLSAETKDLENNTLFSVYPNPSEDYLHLQIPTDESEVSIQVYNSAGQTIQTIDKQPANASLPIHYLDKGIYFVKVETQKSIYTTRFIKK